MSVENGNPANANTFNTSFVSREVDSDTVGVLGLNNTIDPNSGDQIINTQRLINEIADSDGTDGEGDATRKVYGSENVISDGDSRKIAIGKLDGKFNGTTGHAHDGTDGGGPAISINAIADFNQFFAEFQELTFDSASGLAIDVSTEFAVKSPGGNSSTAGVLTSAPGNRVEIVGKDDYREIEDISGNRVFARLTELTGSWSLTFFVNIAGTETAHTLSSQNIRYLYREVFTAATRPTITPSVGLYDSLSAVEDIPAASQTVEGKVTIAAQSFGGVKNFIDGLQKNGVDAATVSDAQTIINKILDGGVATNTRYWQVPSGTTAALTLLTRIPGAIFYSTDELTYYGDDGAALISLGGGSGGSGLDSSFIEDHEELEAADYITGNSAGFSLSGTATALPVNEEALPLSGTRSIKYTQVAGSLNDWGFPRVYTVARKDKGNFLALNFYAGYDGLANEVAIVIRDVSNSKDLQTIYVNTSEIKRYSAIFFCPLNATTLKIGYHVKVENIGAILEFDNYEVSADPFVGATSNPSNTQAFKTPYNVNFWDNTGAVDEFDISLLDNSDNDLFIVEDFSGRTIVRAKQRISYNAGFFGTTSSNGTATVRDSSNSDLNLAQEGSATLFLDAHHSGILNPDDYIYFNMSSVTSRAGGAYFSATGISSNLTIVKNSSASNSMVRVTGTSGFGSINTKVRVLSTIQQNVGSDIDYAVSASLGSSFTIKTDGTYHISLTDAGPDTDQLGFTINSSELTTNIFSLTDKTKIYGIDNVSFGLGAPSWSGELKAGDVIRPHSNGSAGGSTNFVSMTVSKIGTTQVTGVPLPREMFVTYELSNGTNGGNGSIGSYAAIAYNTLGGDIFGTLSGGVLSIPNGKYIFDGSQVFFRGEGCKLRVNDITNTIVAAKGDSVFADNAANRSSVKGRCYGVYSITSQADFQIEARVTTNGLSGATLGIAASFSEPEIYGTLKITKVE